MLTCSPFSSAGDHYTISNIALVFTAYLLDTSGRETFYVDLLIFSTTPSTNLRQHLLATSTPPTLEPEYWAEKGFANEGDRYRNRRYGSGGKCGVEADCENSC